MNDYKRGSDWKTDEEIEQEEQRMKHIQTCAKNRSKRKKKKK